MPLFALPAAAGDTVTRWENFSESTACGASYTRTPHVSHRGHLHNHEQILGPYGTYFGRSVGEIRTRLVSWSVPYSGGRSVLVHEEALPSFERVAEELAEHAADGRIYFINSVATFVPRTIRGGHQLSRHSLGLAIDINPGQNPYRADNKLITDFPDWFVDTWKDAGFCWGGDWKFAKDAMHFSWMGPGQTPENDSLVPLPPDTTEVAFGAAAANRPTEFAGTLGRYNIGIADASGSSGPDVVGVRSHPDGAVIDIANGMFGFGSCSVTRWFVPDTATGNGDHSLFGDIDGDSGNDLITLTANGATFDASTATRVNEFEDVQESATGVGSAAVALASGDFDGDHIADIWAVTPGGDIEIYKGPNWTNLIHSEPLPGGAPIQIAVGDRDGGDRPEIYATYEGRVEVLRLGGGWTMVDEFVISHPSSDVATTGGEDYDGDGRSDFQYLTSDASLIVHIGNSATGAPADRWFTRPNAECEDDPIVLDYDGNFSDDDGSIFETNIESIAAASVTKGCNPPFNDRFCPKNVVTRETMAAFIVRALGLSEINHPGFTDVDPDDTFAQDIARLATAGITKGCNPPANTMFCPKDPVSRETMAAFIVRALGLGDDSHPGFVDVPASNIFANDIRRLAAADITKGCNPPINNMYCPKDLVSRETMAAFLDRAGLGG